MAGATTHRTIKVFIASPGDLAVERRAFKDTIDELNKGFGRGANVTFQPLGWEDALSEVGRRSQSVINQDIDACDVFILLMWRRWGQEAPDAAPYSSYTEEEFYRALARREKKDANGKGCPTVCVFFKHIDPQFLADPGDQLKKVLEFRRKLEETKKALYRPFASAAEFQGEVREHLIGFAQGRYEGIDDDRSVPMVPESVAGEIEKHKEEARRAVSELERLKAEKQQALKDAERARSEARDAIERATAAEAVADARAAKNSVVLAENAAKAALEGKLEEARQDFAKALDGTTNLKVLYLGYQFFKRIGELDEAERLLQRWLSISGPGRQSQDTAAAYGNLGLIERARGNLDAAEAYHKKALAINEKLGLQEGMANQYGSLGNIEQLRGNLDAAEAYLKKSLAIEEKLGRQEGMAADYGNLGLIERARGNLDAAEAYLKKSLAIEEKLGRQEGMATGYGNLGNIEQLRGNLDAAEAYLKKSLAIEEKLGRQEGMAADYGNLGVIERTRGNLDAAEAYHKKSLAINEKLGLQEGMANQYGNIGLIAEQRDKMEEALALWTRARDLYRKIGAKPKELQVQGWLDELGSD